MSKCSYNGLNMSESWLLIMLVESIHGVAAPRPSVPSVSWSLSIMPGHSTRLKHALG